MDAYDQGYDDGRRQERDDRDAEWADALAPLWRLFNGYGIGTGMGEPTDPGEVAERIDDIARGLVERYGWAMHPSELTDDLRTICDRLTIEDERDRRHIAERDKLMGELALAVRCGDDVGDLVHELEQMDTPPEWIASILDGQVAA